MGKNTRSKSKNIILLKEIENFLSSEAVAKNCRYAFSVILPEEKYIQLKDLYKNTNFYDNHNIKIYPWCHLKLLSETFVRCYKKQSDVRCLENFLADAVGVESIIYWYSIPNIINQLNLKRVREEKGPWYIYANLILHSGVPAAYFKEIFEFVKREYLESNKDTERTISNLCNNSDLFKYQHYSKYFKKAFEAPSEKKILIKWFTHLVSLSTQNSDLINQIKEKLPPHLKNLFEKQNLGDNELSQNPIKNKHTIKKRYTGLVFNKIKGVIEFNIEIEQANELANNIYLKENETLPKHWIKELENIKKKRAEIFALPILPTDLPLEISYKNKIIKIFEIQDNDSIEAIIFRSDLKVIAPNEKEILIKNEKDSNLIIITRNENNELSPKYKWSHHIDDLSGGWWDWHHYEWKIESFDDEIFVKFPAPYGEIKIISSYESHVNGNWISDQKLEVTDEIEHFGGDVPPMFRFNSDSFNPDNKPIINATLSDENRTCRLEDITNYEKSNWIWKSNSKNFQISKSRYRIDLEIYDMSFGQSSIAKFSCIWHPSLNVDIVPNHMLWPNEKCIFSIKRSNQSDFNNCLFSDIDESFLTKNENQFTWSFLKKPPDCMPVISIKEQDTECEFYVKLPFISIWVQTELKDQIEQEKLEWSNDRPFLRSFLEEISSKDYKARIRFRAWGKNVASLSIIDSMTNTLIRKISIGREEFDSISCSELLKFSDPILLDDLNNRKAYLFKKDEKWDFKNIFESIRREHFIKKNTFYLKL